MFSLLGKTITRFWPLLLGFWILLFGVSWRLAPSWDEVSQPGDIPSLPEDSPSRRGHKLFKNAFPDEYSDSSIVLVLAREENDTGLQEKDKTFLARVLTPALKELAREEESRSTSGAGDLAGTDRQGKIIARIRAPEDQGIGALLLSRDRREALVLIELTTPFSSQRNWATIEKIEGLITRFQHEQNIPPGLEIAITGSATAGRDVGRAEQKSAHEVEVWTIAVVVALLLLTYRAPLMSLLTLGTVFIAVQVSLQLLSLLAQTQILSPSRDLRIFITVLAYGAGVDYCVFLIARYREELDAKVGDVGEALAAAVVGAGPAVCASGATVICGIGMLAFARFGKIHEAGLVIPFSLVLVLCAALTFAPSLLRLTGRWAFWPQQLTEPAAEGRQGGPATHFLGHLLRRNLLPDIWGRVGPTLAHRPGLIWVTSVAAMAPFAVVGALFYNQVNYDPLGGLPENAPSAAGARLLTRHFPPGLLGPVTILLQNDRVDFDSDKGIGLIRELTEHLEAKKNSLGFVDLRSIARPLGTTEAAKEALAQLPLPPRAIESIMRERAVGYYVSHAGQLKGHVTRIDLVLAVPPFSPEGIEYLDRIEHSLEAELPEGLRQSSQVSFSGPAATVRDLRTVTLADQTRIQILVPSAVFVLLLIVFRRLVASLYLILSVVFSYLATLGGTFVVFWLSDREAFLGLDWKVPLFLFTILVAVGEDYNIFLLSRVEEERKTRGPVQGVLSALARTGRVISTCGFIMAGTFAALFAGSFLAMKELGFALSVGVLLDTLLVRPILVPTFLILLWGRRRGGVRGSDPVSWAKTVEPGSKVIREE